LFHTNNQYCPGILKIGSGIRSSAPASHPLLCTGGSEGKCFTLKARALHLVQKKGIMTRKIGNPVILINHWRWLEANGYKRQAASCKRQASSLTRKYYNDIQEVKGERNYENK